MLSCIQLFATPWTLAPKVPLSTEFPGKEYWSVLPFPPPGDLSNPGIKPPSLMSPLQHWHSDSLPLCHLGIQED